MVRNDIRITFVDLHMHRQTVMFNLYYLYAARFANSGNDLLRIRKELFAIAGGQTVPDEKKDRRHV